MRPAILFAALLALAGCNCGGTHVHGNEGELSFSPDLQFGILGVGESLTRTSTLQNVGSARVTVDALEAAAPYSACIKHPDTTCTADVVLEVGDKADVAVTYAPTAADASDTVNDVGLIVVVNDTPSKPRISINVVGHAVASRLLVTPPALDFGDVAGGETKELPLLLENKGVAAIALSQPGIDNPLFSTDLAKLQGTLARGASISTTVTYSPQAGQDDSGTLSLTTDIGVQGAVKIPLTGRGLAAKITLCFGLVGDTPTCLPDAQGRLAGALDFGVLDETATRTASVVLKSEGNMQVDLFGTATADSAMTSDETARLNPCALTTAVPDFTFTPPAFARRLPADPTAQDPNPPRQQSMQIVYSPHHHCPQDLADSAVLSLKAGSSNKAPTFFVDLKGASKLGLVQTEDVYWDVPTVTPKDYKVFNVGPGPLHVSSVEIVESDDKDCPVGCADRKSCLGSTLPECAMFAWQTGPTAADVAGAPSGGSSEAVVGVLQNTPGALCGGLGMPDGGLCFPTQNIRVCTRVTTDDPFRAVACGELKARTF